MKRHLEDVLEELKKIGNYAVSVFYGEDIGCDDLNIPQNERKIQIIMTPVGVLGGARIMWKGTLETMQDFDFISKPKVISNPPEYDEYKENGYYVWGTDMALEGLFEARNQ